ncbi:MAG TPA: hypothetical protein VK308_13345 [Pyrinomonadaceae bacterium]|nr:hypothetical protein [Pyrinomonadaceae bacterium]
MRKRLLFVLVFSFIAAVSLSAQTRTVTNENLEKYRQKRVAAERDLRENYERLGFPSPEELQRQIEQTRAERAELAERLRAENIERERLNIERQRAVNEARSLDYQRQTESHSTGSYPAGERNTIFSYGYAPYGFYNFPNFGFPNYYPNRPIYRGNFYRNRYHRDYDNHPRVEYRNNLPVITPPAPRIILAPRTNGGRN